MNDQMKKLRVIVLALFALFLFGLSARHLIRLRTESAEDARFIDEQRQAEFGFTNNPAGNSNNVPTTP